MIFTTRVLLIASFSIVFTSILVAQDDSDLPMKIGGNTCESSARAAKATIRGSFNVSGTQNPDQKPKFSIALYAGGIFVSRQSVRNGSAFAFYCVPDTYVTLVAEVDRAEIATVTMGSLAAPPQTNYQDIDVSWSAAHDAVVKRNQVISARNAYERTKDNQKRFDRAMDKLQEDKGQTSLKMLRDLVQLDPNDFVAWSEIGTIQNDNRQFAEAESSFQSALQLKPDYLNALFGIGRAALALKEIERSLKALSDAYKVAPDSPDVNHFLGEAYLQNKQGTLAIQHMRRAIELAPAEKAELHLRIAWLYNAAGAKDLAAEEYRMFLQQRPKYPEKAKLEQYIAENAKK